MKRLIFTVCMLSMALPAFAQSPATVPIWSPDRLSVGARVYDEFDEIAGISGQYSHEWRVGVPFAWKITGLDDPKVTFPISLTGAIDYGITNGSGHPLRLQIGATVLLKKAGQ